MDVQDAVLANVFLAIQNRIVAEVPELKFVDLDTGQLEYKDAKERPMVAIPCALFDFVAADYTDASEGVQEGDIVLQVRIGVDPFTQATHYFTDTQKANAINYFNIEHRVNKALQWWTDGRYFKPLSRASMRTEPRHDGLRVRVLHYKFGLTDWTAMNVPAATVATPDFQIIPPTT